MAKELNKDNFETEVVEASKKFPVLVDFFAPWCGPCQMQGPIIDELGKELDGKGAVAKVNIDENPELAEQYGVMSIPTMILFKDGKPQETMTGLMAKEVLAKLF